MMHSELKLGTWAEIGDGCPLSYTLDADRNIELHFGDRSEGFEVIFSPGALERLLPMASRALAQARRALDPDPA
jgi:hypothetical protein